MEDIRNEMMRRKLALDTSSAITEIGEEKTAIMSDSISQMNVACGENMKERLENMRAELGDEMFDKIVSGASLMSTLDRWAAEKIENHLETVIDKMVDMFKENGHDEITREHIMAYIDMAN
jgi:actin-like ATPase involved in cell morphogenesis